MNLKSLFDKGKKIVDDRGGVDSLKRDAQELQKIAKGKGSMTDKAKEAAAAIKDPGAPGGEGKAARREAGTKPAGGAGQGRQGKQQGDRKQL